MLGWKGDVYYLSRNVLRDKGQKTLGSTVIAGVRLRSPSIHHKLQRLIEDEKKSANIGWWASKTQ